MVERTDILTSQLIKLFILVAIRTPILAGIHLWEAFLKGACSRDQQTGFSI